MHRIASTLTIGFVLTLTGCPGDDSPPTTGADSTTTGASSTTNGTSPTPTTNTPLDSSTTDPGTTTNPDMTTSSTTNPDATTSSTGPDPSDSSSSGAPGEVCDPMDPDPCAACVGEMCCTELEACVADGDETMGCNCFQNCIADGGDVFACAGMCMVGADIANPGTPTGALAGCTQANCGAGICL